VDEDEKERINASVMNIQNGNHLISQLEGIRGTPAVAPVLEDARTRYSRHLTLYARLSLHRVFPRIMDLFSSIRDILASGAVPADEIAFRSEYSKAAAKTALARLTDRAVNEGLALVHSRVVKHFYSDPVLQRQVWDSLRSAFAAEIASFGEIISQVYAGQQDVSLVFNVSEAMRIFERMAADLSGS
jgi:hypothetical protein